MNTDRYSHALVKPNARKNIPLGNLDKVDLADTLIRAHAPRVSASAESSAGCASSALRAGRSIANNKYLDTLLLNYSLLEE